MALQWEGEIANASETATSGVTVTGRLYCDVSRTNNTITVTNIQVGHNGNPNGLFWDWEWQADAWCNGTKVMSNWQTKGRTGGSAIGTNWYNTGTQSHSFGVGTGSGSFNLQGNWESGHYGYASSARTVSVSYPAAGAPSTPGRSVTDITTTSAKITWTVGSAGAHCTYSSTRIDWGLTTSYGSSQTGLPQNGSYTITNLTPGQTYYYRIRATNGAGLSTDVTGTITLDPVPSIFGRAPL